MRTAWTSVPGCPRKLAPNCSRGEVVQSFTSPSESPAVAKTPAPVPKETLEIGAAAASSGWPTVTPVVASQRWTTPDQEPVTSVPSGENARLTFGAPNRVQGVLDATRGRTEDQDAAVVAADRDARSVGGESDRRACVPERRRADECATPCAPDCEAAEVDGGNQAAVGRKRDRLDRPVEAFERPTVELDACSTGDGQACPRPVQRRDGTDARALDPKPASAGKRMETDTRSPMPYRERASARRNGKRWCLRDGLELAGLCTDAERVPEAAGAGDIPLEDRAVERIREERSAIGAEGARDNAPSVARQGVKQCTGGRVPELHDTVVTGGDDSSVVGSEVDGKHSPTVHGGGCGHDLPRPGVDENDRRRARPQTRHTPSVSADGCEAAKPRARADDAHAA